MDEQQQEEFDFAVNEAAIYFEEGNLTVAFSDGRIATMEIEREEEREIIKKVLADANTWAMFLQSLSAALKAHA